MKKKKCARPKKPSILFRTLLKIVSTPDLKKVNFKYEKIGMEKLGKREPALFLMNHSSFVDLEIVSSMLYPRPFNIIATSDAFIGKHMLMWLIGCIPTKDGFVLDGCDGKLHYEQKPLASYSLNSDFNWYEIGDVIGIGNNERLYCCFPKSKGDIVAKARLAQEELHKILKGKVKSTATL